MNRAEKRRHRKLSEKVSKKKRPAQTTSVFLDEKTLNIQSSLEQAVQYHNAGKFAEAEKLYQRVLKLDPEQHIALNFLGLLALQVGKYDTAIKLIQRALEIKPDYFEAYNNLGTAYQQSGHLNKAVECFGKSIEISPDNVDANYRLGNTFIYLGKLNEAIARFHRVLSINPVHAEALNNLGNSLKGLGKIDEAIDCFCKALAVKPDFIEVQNNLGIAHVDKGNLDEALTWFSKALANNPDYADAHYNMGGVFKELNELSKAVSCYQKAISINPKNAAANYNLGNAYKELGKFDEAISSYNQAIQINPDYAEAYNNLGILQLLLGNFDEGWMNYAWRMKIEKSVTRQRYFNQPQWNGKEISESPNSPSKRNKLLVWMEQGVGDEIMFASILADAQKKAATIVVECDERLVPVFNRSFPIIDFVARKVPPLEKVTGDQIVCQIPAASLGKHFRTNSDAFGKPYAYLKPDNAKKSALRNDYTRRWPGKRLVGVAWRSGNVSVGKLRSLPLNQWQPILSNKNCQFINLQYGDVTEELTTLKAETGLKIFDDTEIDQIINLDDFAAQISALDLVISVDNSTVHVSGALGVNSWVMLPYVPDWRWFLERDDALWYPKMRLFRQHKSGDWNNVIKRVSEHL